MGPYGGRINIGAYGNTEEASRSSIAPTHTLTVLSAPVLGIDIAGDKPGVTDYTATCDDQEVVDLSAPVTATMASVRYDFVRWIVDGTDQSVGQTDVLITVDAEITATDVYAVRTHTLNVLSMPASPS